MVDDEPDLRQRTGTVDGRRQLARPDQEVVREPGGAHGRDAPPDVGASQPVRIGLVVDLVADPDEAVAARAVPKPGDRVGDRRVGQVDPADDAGDERVAAAMARKLSRLLEARARLDEDRRVDPRGGEEGGEVVGSNARRIGASSSVSHG